MNRTEPRKDEPGAGQPPNTGAPQQWRIPRSTRFLFMALLAMFVLIFWLLQSVPPRPLPEIPPHKVVPADVHHPQDPRPEKAPDAAERP